MALFPNTTRQVTRIVRRSAMMATTARRIEKDERELAPLLRVMPRWNPDDATAGAAADPLDAVAPGILGNEKSSQVLTASRITYTLRK